MSLERIAKHFMVHHSTPDYCLCSQDHWVYRYHYQSRKLEPVCRVPPRNEQWLTRLKDAVARSWPLRAWSKALGLGHVTEMADGSILIIYDRIYLARPGEKWAQVLCDLDSRAIFPPLRNGIALHPESNNAYFGEYINGTPREIRIFRINAQGCEPCHRFAAGEIKHVHGIFWDKFRKRLWVTTGDSDSQSAFYYTDDEFQTLHRYQGGCQSFRAVSLIATQDYLYWGMDAGKDAPADAINKLFRLHLASGERTELAVIANPAYHMTQTLSGRILLGTTFEPGRKQQSLEEAAIWSSTDGEHWQKILALPYQSAGLSGRTQYAHIFLPTGVIPDDQLLLTPLNVEQSDHQLLRLPL